MANNKEYKEFFLRHTQVTSGNKVDQETNFPTQYSVGGTLKFNRFLKGDYPSENIFTKLFNSITFKLNVEDTATETQQGLTRYATDNEAIARINSLTTEFANVVKPSQLPNLRTIALQNSDVLLGTTTKDGISFSNIITDIIGDNTKTKRDFAVQAAVDNSIEIVSDRIQLVNDVANDSVGANMVYGTDVDGLKGWIDKELTFSFSNVDIIYSRVSGVPTPQTTESYSVIITAADGALITSVPLFQPSNPFQGIIGWDGVSQATFDNGGGVVSTSFAYSFPTNAFYHIILWDEINNVILTTQTFFIENTVSQKYVDFKLPF